jgi:methylaspartate ammonia-lyase
VIDMDGIERDIGRLVAAAIEAATSLEELVDAARAAAAVGTPSLLEAVAVKVGEHVATVLSSSGAWEAELTYSKIDAWAQTGHRARLLAEAWGLIAPGLRTAREASGPSG